MLKVAPSKNRTPNQKMLTASNDADDECCICFDPVTNKAFASDCLHNFCYHCIFTWVQLRATCPLCLQPITSIIKNVRSIDDYDIEQVTPPQIDAFSAYLGDFDMPDDVFDYDFDSDLDDESMSTTSDPDHELLEFYEDDLSDVNVNVNVQTASHSSQESFSPINIFGGHSYDGEYGTEEGEEDDEVSENPFTENFASSSEDEKDDDENGDNDENDENHSENGEFFGDNDDEEYDDNDYDNNDYNDYDDNNNEDEYEDDDGNEDYADFSDTYDEEEYEDVDQSSLAPFYPSEYDSEERSQDQGYVLSRVSEYDDSDSDPDYTFSPLTASNFYSCRYY